MADFAVAVRLSADGSGLVGQLKAGSTELDKLARAEKGAADAAVAVERNTANMGQSIAKSTRSVGEMRAGSVQLGQQLQDIGIQAQAGTSAFTILAQQGGQAASALALMGGTVGRVGAFLAGPFGTAIILATALLGPFVTKLFESEDASKKAGAALTDFQRRQLDIGKFIDATTGRLVEQNKTLIENAKLTRQAAIDKNNVTIRDSTKTAFDAAGKAAVTGSRFVSERQPFANTYDPAILDTIRAASGDAGKLDIGLRALASRRPDLEATVKLVSDAASEAILAARENKKYGLEIDQLSGKVKAQGAATSGLIEKQVALATATTAVERARAKYAIVQSQGAAADKIGGDALVQYRNNLTAAANAVNAAEAAEKRATLGRREGAKVTRDAVAEALKAESAATKSRKEFVSGIEDVLKELERQDQAAKKSALELQNLYDPAAASARKFAEETKRINETLAAGAITPGQARLFTDRAEQAGVVDEDRAIKKRASDFADYIGASVPEIGEDFGTRAADTFQSQVTEAASAIGQLIGGSTGSAIGKAIGAIQGLGSLGKGSSPFAQAFAGENKKLLGQVTGKLDSIFGGSGASGFAATAGKAFAGAGQGVIAGSVLKGLGIKSSSTGSAIGGAIGSALPIPGGALIGGIIGGLLGGLFKKPKTGSATIGNVDGSADVTGTSGNSSGQKQIATGLGNAVSSSLSSIVNALGAELGTFSVSIGKRDKKFTVDPSGKGRTKGSGVLKFSDEGEAQAAAIRDALADGAVTGLSAAVQRALKSSTDIDKAVNTALKVQAVEELIGGFGATAAKAFRAFEKQAADRLKIATQYGFDLVKLEEINGKQRVALFDQVLEAQTGSLKQLLASINGGALFEGSAVDKRNALQAQVDKLRIDSAAGVEGANDKLAQALSDLVSASKDAYGTGAGYAADRSNVTSIAQQIINQATAEVKAAQQAAQDAVPAKIDTTNALLNEGNNQTAQLLAAYNLNTQSLGSVLSRVVGGGVFNTSRQAAF